MGPLMCLAAMPSPIGKLHMRASKRESDWKACDSHEVFTRVNPPPLLTHNTFRFPTGDQMPRPSLIPATEGRKEVRGKGGKQVRGEGREERLGMGRRKRFLEVCLTVASMAACVCGLFCIKDNRG